MARKRIETASEVVELEIVYGEKEYLWEFGMSAAAILAKDHGGDLEFFNKFRTDLADEQRADEVLRELLYAGIKSRDRSVTRDEVAKIPMTIELCTEMCNAIIEFLPSGDEENPTNPVLQQARNWMTSEK